MGKFIELHLRETGGTIYVNTEYIMRFSKVNSNSTVIISTDRKYFMVSEMPEVIFDMINN